jgi:GTP-binding protein
VVVNKVDRADARPNEVVNEVFDLLVNLEANNQSLDFPILFASARQGWASRDLANPGTTMEPVFNAILTQVPPPRAEPDKPLQILVTTGLFTAWGGSQSGESFPVLSTTARG